jgi:hypothetical protein
VVLLLPATLLACSAPAPSASPTTAGSAHPADYSTIAARALAVLEHRFYAGGGEWALCIPDRCVHTNTDWGADSLTYALYLHWQRTDDPGVAPIMAALTATARRYAPTQATWSDVPLWDSVADVREYQVTRDPTALEKAEAAFAVVAGPAGAARFARGACPEIDYQQRLGGVNKLKTLETDSNYVKAALLLFTVTHDRAYLSQAVAKYAAIRRWFLDPGSSLYTVYVFDAGGRCAPLPGRYFGSVNGNMIWDGLELAILTGDARYRAEATATAAAADRDLADGAGVYADLQAENDVGEPLVEAMGALGGPVGRGWILGAAAAAASDVDAAGAYGRFFDGPAPRGTVTAWQSNGGIALQFLAAALEPAGVPAGAPDWARARFVPDDLRLGGAPVAFTFDGSAVAILGTIGERCCEAGHAEVLVDGVQTFDRTGIWQDKSSSGRSLPGSILFAWRFAHAGRHTIEIRPGVPDAKEGGSFFHMTGYLLLA